MTFERTRDLELIRRAIAFDARVWRASIDDGAPAREDWRPIDDERVFYVIAHNGRPAPNGVRGGLCAPDRDSGIVALFTLLPQNAVCYELHMDRVFGARPARALRELFGWAFEHTPARRIVASIPADNPIAIRAARRAGMQEYGRNPASFLRGGELQDQILFGVSKPCRQS